MSSYYECPECHALTDKHAQEMEHRPSCSHSTAFADADDRITELERRVEDLVVRLEALEAMVVP